jgi:hypothetical protein
LADTYYAFSDAVESVGRSISVRFDAIRSREFALLERLGSFEEAERELEPRLLEFTVASGGAEAFPGLGGRRIRTDRWYELTLDNDGVPANAYDGPEAADPEPVRIKDVGFLDGRSDPARSLARLVSLDNVPDSRLCQCG